MPGSLPQGEPAPADGALPQAALAGLGARPFGFYVHVPFCASRCGYCDFTTYTPDELADGGTARRAYLEHALTEIRLARRVLGDVDVPVATVFVGGGTPTLLDAAELGRVLRAVHDEFGLVADAEVTTEANPESVDAAGLAALREVGFTRVSFGMQSAREHVLLTLDRRHTPGRALAAVADAQAAGFEHVNLDLIYGTPGETDADWAASLDAAVSTGCDHVSAYALVVEDGTRLAAQVRRGALPAPDDDLLADRYLAADERLGAAGLGWYEVSNWARDVRGRCRHNEGYWRGGDWWGVGPGAHSHVQGVRWWNVRHPTAYAERLTASQSPAAAREVLGAGERHTERVLLEIRTVEGLPLGALAEPDEAKRFVDDGLLDATAYRDGRVVLTLRGRLLADTVVRALVPD